MKREDQDFTSPVGAKRRCSSSDFTSSSPVMTSSDQLPDQKTIKYDRQLRLWGDHGQTALEKAKVCLIGATATGTEILKNLVLPGLGSFCIVDHALVKAGDLGNNFFVTAQDIGQSRAEAATRLLLEMNGDVQGEYLMEPIESLIENRPKFFQHFTVVITADLACEKILQSLGKILWAAGIPLVVCRAFGLVGSIRLVCQEHLVTEAKPDNFIQDLRLEDPFPELMALRNEFDFRTMGKKAHSHVPYVIVLLAFLERWKTIHGALPISYKDKLKFREFVDEGRWKNEDGVPLTEENFDEACKAVVKTIGILKVPDEIQQLFDDPSCHNLTIYSPKFWILVRAIRDFTIGEGASHLPVSGSLPDMFSDTENFVRLQNLYKCKADADAQIVHLKASQICQDLGLSIDLISLAEVKYYCRNAAFLRCVRTPSLEEEYGKNSSVGQVLIGSSQEDPQFRSSLWYLMLRSVDEFFGQRGTLPGLDDKTYEDDAIFLKNHVLKNLKTLQVSDEFRHLLTDEVLENFTKETARFGGQQVHSVSAFIGGAVAQEVIKLITGQYLPLNDTLIYDATACTTATFQF